MSPAAGDSHRTGTDLPYAIDVAALPSRIRERVVELTRDAGTDSFLAEAERERHGSLRTAAHRFLRQFMSDFDVNGWLDMYSLFLLSAAHWITLLGDERIPRLLDVGAGSGKVTAELLPLVDHAVATELSSRMAKRLRARGIECHEIDLAEGGLEGQKFELITCLNVLDRTARPKKLLRRLKELLAPGGRLVIALALPYRPFYYQGPATPDPVEPLACTDERFETAVTQLIERELEPIGFELTSLSRAPYLSFGDTKRALYQLGDAILVLRAAGPERT